MSRLLLLELRWLLGVSCDTAAMLPGVTALGRDTLFS